MRPSFDNYFMQLAHVVATRSTCNRKQVGAVLVRSRRILSTGYGGSIKGQPHCTEVGCDIDPKTGGCIRTVHAETNAIAQAACNGVSTEGSTIYVTLSPCYACFKMLANSGVVRIVFDEAYRLPLPEHEVQACGIELAQVHVEPVAPAGMLLVSEAEFQRLLDERARLYQQITDVQQSNTQLLMRIREVANVPSPEKMPRT